MEMAERRAGFTVNEKGDQALLGWIPERLDGVNSGWIGALRGVNDAIRVGVVQPLATQNDVVIAARTSRTAAAIPEPEVRAKLARTVRLKNLEREEKKLAVVEDQMFLKAYSLKPFDYEDGSVGRDNREELRKTFIAMTKEQKAAALQKTAFLRAVLEQEPEVTSLTASQHEQLRQEQIKRRYPQETSDLNDARETAERVKLTAQSARKLVLNELAQVGVPAVDAVPATPEKAWA
jgi:hypothetical protein